MAAEREVREDGWEDVGLSVYRLSVPGGWLVCSNFARGNSIGPGVGAGTSLIFLKDEQHLWQA